MDRQEVHVILEPVVNSRPREIESGRLSSQATTKVSDAAFTGYPIGTDEGSRPHDLHRGFL